jgi:hypothetical protein
MKTSEVSSLISSFENWANDDRNKYELNAKALGWSRNSYRRGSQQQGVTSREIGKSHMKRLS